MKSGPLQTYGIENSLGSYQYNMSIWDKSKKTLTFDSEQNTRLIAFCLLV